MKNYDLLYTLRPMARRLNTGTALTLTQIVMIAADMQNLAISRSQLHNVTNLAMSTVAGHLRELRSLGLIDFNSQIIRLTHLPQKQG